MIDCYMCIDTGNSGTKIAYSFPKTNSTSGNNCTVELLFENDAHD